MIMKTEEVKFRRYTPSEGKALKITERSYNYLSRKFEDSVRYTDERGCVVDENTLAAPVEEVPMEECEEWRRKYGCCLGITSICR